MAGGILRAGGNAAAAEAAEMALGPLGAGLAAAGVALESADSMDEGMPWDVAVVMGYTKIAGGVLGGSYGSVAGAALGGLAGMGPGDIVTIPAGAIGGGFDGAVYGEKIGGGIGGFYARSRGYNVE